MAAERLNELFGRYIKRRTSPEENEELWGLMADVRNEAAVSELLEKVWVGIEPKTPSFNAEDSARLLQQILTRTQTVPRPVRTLWPRIAAAASILLFLSIGGYYIFHKQPVGQTAYYKNDIKPGNNGAILTLANGRKIVLEQTKAGKIIQQNGTDLRKAGDSLLVYQAAGAASTTVISYNTLETPKGKQYSVVLPDGSKVWLNAASVLKYPTTFAKERLVELTGEAYFEVVHNSEMPFRVKTNNQIAEDIGTHFNINAYADEPSIKTTLLEGAVKVNGILLSPGQQTDGKRATTVNTEETMAWKNGYFMFEDENIQPIMRKIARWYNVDIVYTGDIPSDKFWGTVSRFGNVSQVLKKLELTKKVHFEIEGRRIMVSQ